MKVLIVDDDDISRTLMAETLEAAGHVVSELPSPIGVTGVMLKRQVDVVVIDVMMPSLNGDKLAKLIRGHRDLRRVGVVLVSGSEGESMRELAQSAGCSAFVGKSKIRESLPAAVVLAAQEAKTRVDDPAVGGLSPHRKPTAPRKII